MAVKEAIEGKPSFQNTLEFVCDERVSSVPIDTKVQVPPISQWRSQEQWERMFYITGQYLGTDKTLDEIGIYMGISKERISQIVEEGVRQLYQIQDPVVRGEFSLEKFDYGKPLTIASRRRWSAARGGRAIRAEELFRKGRTPGQIREDLNIRDIGNVRKILGNWGTEIPYECPPILPRFKRLRDTDLADKEKQELLDTVINPGMVKVLSSGEKPLLAIVSIVARKAGLFFRVDKTRDIYKVLRDKDIPASFVSHATRINKKGEKKNASYYFICATDIGRAIEVIKGASELNSFRESSITELSKSTDEVPRVVDLLRSGNYSHITSVVEIRGKRIKSEDIFAKGNCSVPVYRYQGSVYYPREYEDELRAYLFERLEELGLI